MQLSDATFSRFAVWMKAQTGVHFPIGKKTLVHQRLTRRLAARNVATFEAYFRMLQDPAELAEREAAIDLLTTHETFFFREPKHFHWLEAQLRQHPVAGTLRIWSAASSSGEEVWSIAMLLADIRGLDGDWTLMGSDISQGVLARAEKGHYTLQRCEGMPPDYLRRFCLKGVRQHAGTFMVCKELRRKVNFQLINLDRELPAIGPYHVIFLRNVLIYFDAATKLQVVQRVLGRLSVGGFLLVSHSESLHGLPLPIQLVAPGIYRKLS
ncbi:MAG: CheR family methyltransferase [Vogesella sp.]|uniref:CheR family methyltransferase n=1 Tax=Vogesella sp. TaxID=1904252 RepID=UPI003F3E3842